MKKIWFTSRKNRKRIEYWVHISGFWWNGIRWVENSKGNYLNYLPKYKRHMCNVADLYTEDELLKCLIKGKLSLAKISEQTIVSIKKVEYRKPLNENRRYTYGDFFTYGIRPIAFSYIKNFRE